MPKKSYLFSSESVSEGHPDKIADQISDAVLDAALAQDPSAKVACETLITRGLVLVAGETKTTTHLDIPAIVRTTIADIGYTDRESGFDLHACCFGIGGEDTTSYSIEYFRISLYRIDGPAKSRKRIARYEKNKEILEDSLKSGEKLMDPARNSLSLLKNLTDSLFLSTLLARSMTGTLQMSCLHSHYML